MHNTQPRRSRTLLKTTLLAALGAVAAPAAMAQTWVPFDDFAAGSLSASKWQGDEGRQYGGIRLEASRSVVSGQLRLSTRGFGDNLRNADFSSVRNGVIISKSAAVTALKGTITMRSATLVNCTGNPNVTAARARLFGFFFNSGQPLPGSFMNDVFAGAQVYRFANSTDAVGVFKIVGFVGQCRDDSCIASTTLESRDLGTVTVNTPVTLSMVWNASANTFTFQRDANAPQTITYTVNDTAAASGNNGKRLEVSANIAQCAGTRAGVNMSADFDNISTNALPSTPASAPPMGTEMVDDPVVGTIN